jgi:hypothetical protein
VEASVAGFVRFELGEVLIATIGTPDGTHMDGADVTVIHRCCRDNQ